jgi:hypothetical protein
MRKQAIKHFFRIEKILLPFRFEAKMMAVFRVRFASFHFEAKMMEVFRFRFASFRFEAKIMAVFRFFFVLFSLRSISFRFSFLCFASMRNKRKKHIFRIEAKKLLLPFRIISLQSENNGAPYSWYLAIGP